MWDADDEEGHGEGAREEGARHAGARVEEMHFSFWRLANRSREDLLVLTFLKVSAGREDGSPRLNSGLCEKRVFVSSVLGWRSPNFETQCPAIQIWGV
jgi:hypothetical protein